MFILHFIKIAITNNILQIKPKNWISSPYEHLVWDYKKADTNSIRKALKQVNWEFLFKKKNVHEQAPTPE